MSAYYPGELAHAAATKQNLVPDRSVARMRFFAADWGASKAMQLLDARRGHRLPDIKFFKQSAATGDVLGSAEVGGTEIHIRDDLDLPSTAAVAAHETAHAFGSSNEDHCRSIQQQVKQLWIEYQRRVLPQLSDETYLRKRGLIGAEPSQSATPVVEDPIAHLRRKAPPPPRYSFNMAG